MAGYLTRVVQDLSPMAALATTLVLAMAVTPFLNNAATVLVMGPIAAKLAARLGLNPDQFLMAVALGAACDFLTPIGHQCNTLVMGPGGYRFGDYARLGFPLSILVITLGIPPLAFFLATAAGVGGPTTCMNPPNEVGREVSATVAPSAALRSARITVMLGP